MARHSMHAGVLLAAAVVAIVLAGSAQGDPALSQGVAETRRHLDRAGAYAQQLLRASWGEEAEEKERAIVAALDDALTAQNGAHERLAAIIQQEGVHGVVPRSPAAEAAAQPQQGGAAEHEKRDGEGEHALAESEEADGGDDDAGSEAARRAAEKWLEFRGGSDGVDSVHGVLHRVDTESHVRVESDLEEAKDALAALRRQLAHVLSKATLSAEEAHALLAKGPAVTDVHARMETFLHATVHARTLLHRVKQARALVQQLSEVAAQAAGAERDALELVPFPDCERRMLVAEERVERVEGNMPAQMENYCHEAMQQLFRAREDLNLLAAQERSLAVDGTCTGVHTMYARKRAGSAARACRRMRIVAGEVVALGRHRLALSAYRCNPARFNETCSGHGVCVNKQCYCAPGWKGADCGFQGCVGGCSGHGFCDRGQCRCRLGWTGEHCDEVDCPRFGGSACGGDERGLCMLVNGTAERQCMCADGFKGEACEQAVCPFGKHRRSECAGRGTCGTDGACACFRGWRGPACEERYAEHGVCSDTGACICDAGWNGAACDLRACPGDCAGHGTCDGTTGKCVCEGQFTGPGCDFLAPRCPTAHVQGYEEPLSCSGRGLCRPKHAGSHAGKCVCPPGWTGKACETAACPMDCMDGRHGVCKRGKCSCFTGYAGEACERHLPAPPMCSEECSQACLATPECHVAHNGGHHNVNRRLYELEAARAHEHGSEHALLEVAARNGTVGPSKQLSCFVGCTRQCVVERCWVRGAEYGAAASL